MNKLRLDYLLDQGCEVTENDVLVVNGEDITANTITKQKFNEKECDTHLITVKRLEWRGASNPFTIANCPNFPIVTNEGYFTASTADWDRIVSWKPDLQLLIGMQDAHDKKETDASQCLLSAVYEQSEEMKDAKDAQIFAFLDIMAASGKFLNYGQVKFMQDNGMLAEIILPLEAL